MSDVKRYDPTATYGRGHMIVAKRGDFVRHSDYAALEARLAEVERDRDEQSTLAAVRQARAERAETALATAQHTLVVWDAAHRTGRNEPLFHAFEVGVEALTAIRALIAQEEPTT